MIKNSWVLMTAMPPTTGHRDLIQFADLVAEGDTHVVVCTQPGEPFIDERPEAIRMAFPRVVVHHFHREIPQAPQDSENFWPMWKEILDEFGFQPGDYVVSSETYGVKLAEVMDGVFMPYDLERRVNWAKATLVREDIESYWHWILPEFKHNLRKTVTIFGAESCGKTTASRRLAEWLGTRALPEWARPYLETVGPEVTVEKMHTIWRGQAALQDRAFMESAAKVVVQDTDLFSTLGFWRYWSPETVPDGLELSARIRASDLYIIMDSSIPMEQDPLRYGGDVRETTDQYWIDLCEEFALPYVVVSGEGRETRFGNLLDATVGSGALDLDETVLQYNRKSND